MCRDQSTEERSICSIICGAFGLFGYIFVDFGDQFVTLDPTGIPPSTGTITGISKVFK